MYWDGTDIFGTIMGVCLGILLLSASYCTIQYAKNPIEFNKSVETFNSNAPTLTIKETK